MSSHEGADLNNLELFATILSRGPGARLRSSYRTDNMPNHGHNPAMRHLKMDRIRRFLDILSRIVVSDPEQVAAATVQIEPDPTTGKIKTCAYIAYNHELSPQLKTDVVKHISDIFLKLKSIDVPGNLGASASIRAMGIEGGQTAIDLSTMINAFSSRVLLSCIGEQIDMLDQLEEELVKDTDAASELFSPEDLRVIAQVIAQLRLIHATTGDIQKVSECIGLGYIEWTESGYLPRPTRALDEDEWADNGLEDKGDTIRLFRRVEIFMARRKPRCIYFRMERWIARFASAYRWSIALMQQRLSKSFKEVYDGSITFTIVPTLIPRHKSLMVDLDRDTLSLAISSIRNDYAKSKVVEYKEYYSYELLVRINNEICDEPIQQFIDGCLLADSRCQLDDLSVHCELSMLSYIRSRNIAVYNYFGTSTPSCTMCDLYLRAFGKISQKRYFVRSPSHRRIDPRWTFPLTPVPAGDDDKLAQENIRDILQELLREAVADRLVLITKKALQSKSREEAAAAHSYFKKMRYVAKSEAAMAADGEEAAVGLMAQEIADRNE